MSKPIQRREFKPKAEATLTVETRGPRRLLSNKRAVIVCTGCGHQPELCHRLEDGAVPSPDMDPLADEFACFEIGDVCVCRA